MRDRTISVYSAGKLFSATGIRSGWIIGPTELIRAARTSHQYTFFCQNNLAEMTLARCLQDISKPGNTYVHDTARKLCKHRNLLVRALL
jgi:aspartate/methionine/tyrosine aminotransferase